MGADADDERIIQYLLGQLPLPEQAEIENRFVSDAGYFDRICAAEESLIEDYLTGALGSALHRRFEDAYLRSPERRKRVEFARSLREALKLHIKAESFNAVSPKKSERAAGSAVNLLWFVLSPGLVRDSDDGPAIVAFGPETDEIVMELDLNAPEEFETYQASLQSIHGEAIGRADNLTASAADSGSRVRWQISSKTLRNGDYLLSLYGSSAGKSELIDNYYFRVRSG